MDRSKKIRDEIVKVLKKNNFEMVTVEINGTYFSAADIAIRDKQGNIEIYRISVMKYNQQKCV